MEFEKYFVQCVAHYPSLYLFTDPQQSRQAVLNQTFFVNGNGLCWHDGYLADREYGKPTAYGVTRRLTRTRLREITTRNQRPGYLEDCKRFNDKLPVVVYPICEYAKVVGLPDNIRPDWLLAAEEALTWAARYFSSPELYQNDYYSPTRGKGSNAAEFAAYLAEQLDYVRKAQARCAVLRAAQP